MTDRKIIHVDMDAFYASVEQRDSPEYQGRPVIVGGPPNGRGVVAACSYEARQFGIHSAMPSARACRLCPDAIFLRPRFEVYRECSVLIRAIFQRFTDIVEPLSLDEAYLDVTDSPLFNGSATLIAGEIKQQISSELDLTASAGVSYNKFLAKIASDMDKPDGLYVIRPEQAQAFIDDLPIRKFFGIGKVTEKKMNDVGIFNGSDLKAWEEANLQKWFGKSGRYYYRISRGIDHRPVSSSRMRKSIGAETTFSEDLLDIGRMKVILERLAERVHGSLKRKDMSARTVTLKVKYHDFQLITRSKSPGAVIDTLREMMELIDELIPRTRMGVRPVRLLGVSLSGLSEDGVQDNVAEPQIPLFQS